MLTNNYILSTRSFIRFVLLAAIIGGALGALIGRRTPVAHAAASKTWYIRTDGGSATQCNGHVDAAYPGTGTNQPCALAHPFWMMQPNAAGWRSDYAGGDVVIISPGTYFMGYDPSNARVPNQNGAGSCYSGWVYDCHLPVLPSGTPSFPTIWKGSDANNRPKFVGIKGAYFIFGVAGVHDFRLENLEITDGAQCGSNPRAGAAISQLCPAGADNAANGIYGAHASDFTINNVWIHGMSSVGVVMGGTFGTANYTNVKVSGNPQGGFDMDSKNVNGGPYNDVISYGTVNFTDFTITWNGCIENFPYTADASVAGCAAQNENVISDGLGTGETAAKWNFLRGTVAYNTHDGLDNLHAGCYNSFCPFYTYRQLNVHSNGGNQLKATGGAILENNRIVGNCDFFDGKSFSVMGTGFNGDNCRAGGDTIAIVGDGSADTFITNNTIVGRSGVMFLVGCATCSKTTYLRNNIFVGLNSFTKSNEHVGWRYDTSGSVNFNESHNQYFGIKNNYCGGPNAICEDPLLVGESLPQIATDAASSLQLTSTSPGRNKGLAAGALIAASGESIPSIDLLGTARPIGIATDLGANVFGSVGDSFVSATPEPPTPTPSSVPVSTPAPTPVNQKPVANSGGPYNGVVGQIVQFDGSKSFDSDGSVVDYQWDFGDGRGASGATPTHLFAEGIFNVNLTVKDNAGATSSIKTTVTITSPLAAPAAPTNLILNGFSGVANATILTWRDNSTNETSFSVERGLSVGQMKPISNAPADTTIYTDASASGTQTYYYRVCASNKIGFSCSNVAMKRGLSVYRKDRKNVSTVMENNGGKPQGQSNEEKTNLRVVSVEQSQNPSRNLRGRQ